MAEEKTIPLGDGEDEVEVNIETPAEETQAAPETESKAPEDPPRPDKDSDDEELSSYSEGVKKRIRKLTWKSRENERQLNEALEVTRRVLQENEQLKKVRFNQDKQLTSEYENRLKAQQARMTDLLRNAIEAGDANAQTKHQEELAGLAVEFERVRVAKLQLENHERQSAAPPSQQQPQQTQPQQQQERPEPEPKAQEWAERNEWFGQDQPMTMAAFQIHQSLVAEEGYDPASDDYYSELDTRIKAAFPAKFRQAPKPIQTVAGARPSAAPAKSRTIKLSPSQAAIAKKLGISYEDYARHYQKLHG